MSNKKPKPIANYRLRPAKGVERRMMCETFGRLSLIAPLQRYQYIGFGAVSFADFLLIHRQLGITDMTSIDDAKPEAQERFKFNLPFKCVKLEFERSTKALATMPLKTPTIIWLDYTDSINRSIIEDVEYVCDEMSAGSVVVVSINVHALTTEVPDPKIGQKRLDKLRLDVGEELVPADIKVEDLGGWNFAKVSYRILTDRIRQAVVDRLAPLRYEQLFHFWYQDGAKMLTLGGILLDDDTAEQWKKSGVEQFPHCRPGASPFEIVIPDLTVRELRHLDQSLPRVAEDPVAAFLPQDDVAAYERIYRFFPLMAETDL